MDTRHTGLLDESIQELFKNALRISIARPSLGLFILKTLRQQDKAAKVRGQWLEKGLEVPPFLITSITNSCNLKCAGCYNRYQHKAAEGELSSERLRELFDEGEELGISICLLAGGEPLTRGDIIEIAGSHPNIIFPIFTNGLLINDSMINEMSRYKNIIPVISLEGDALETDNRRGDGVYDGVMKVMSQLSEAGVFFGLSITVTSRNVDVVAGDSFIAEMVAKGCSLFFFVEYVPFDKTTESLVIDEEQRDFLLGRSVELRRKFPALLINFPGDEEEFGGCLAAGRGFLHISAKGDIEPCPFAPFSDTNIARGSLKDALDSRLLRVIRENYEELNETKGGCALWSKSDWVQSLLAK